MFTHRLPSAPLALSMATLLLMAAMLTNAGAAEETDAATPKTTELECIGSYNEVIQGFAQYSHYVFLYQGYTLRVLDIANPAHPAEIAWMRFKSEIKSIAIKWPALYVGLGGGGDVFNVSDPAHPKFATSLTDGGDDLSILNNDLVAELQDRKGINYVIYNIQNPFSPVKRHEGSRYVFYDSTWSPRFFATDGTHYFKAVSVDEDEESDSSDDNDESDDDEVPSWTMVIKDVTSTAKTLGRIKIPQETEEGVALAIRQGKLVAGDSRSTTIPLATITPAATIWCYDRGGLGVLQEGQSSKNPATNPVAIKREKEEMLRFYTEGEGTSPTPRGTYGEHAGARQFKIAGKRGYLIDGGGGLQILDMTDPTHPRRLGRLNGLGEEPVIRAVDDDLVFLSGKEPGLRVYDCSQPASPVLRGAYPQACGPISIQSRRAYVAAAEAGLQILDISNPAAIRPLGHYPTPKPARDLATSGSLVYVLMAGELRVIDAATPAQPRLLGKTALELSDNYGCLNDGDPMLLKKLGPALYAIQLGDSTHINIATCQVIDISNPAQPRPMPNQIGTDNPNDSDEGDPHTATPRQAQPPTPYSGCYLCLSSGYYRARSWDAIDINNLETYDLSNPLEPAFLCGTNALHTSDFTALYKNIIYLTDGEGGLVMLRPTKH